MYYVKFLCINSKSEYLIICRLFEQHQVFRANLARQCLKSLFMHSTVYVCDFPTRCLAESMRLRGAPMVRCVKFHVNMANFICQFFKVFCFSNSNLKTNKSLCGAVYRGPKPDVFLVHAQPIEFQNLDFSVFWETFSNFAPAFLPNL